MKKFMIEVRVTDEFDNENGHKVLEWLKERGLRPMKHFEIDMHGGQTGYTSFYFKSKRQARMVTLHWT